MTLRAGQLLPIESARDTRCPTNVTCTQAGEARGTFEFGPSRAHTGLFGFELSTLRPRTAEILGFRVILVSLSPSPGGQPIPADGYVAELLIER